MTSSVGPCPDCKSDNTGSSPTGDWCNDCGWAYPGYRCERCHRESVDEVHLRLPERTLCKTYLKKVSA